MGEFNDDIDYIDDSLPFARLRRAQSNGEYKVLRGSVTARTISTAAVITRTSSLKATIISRQRFSEFSSINGEYPLLS